MIISGIVKKGKQRGKTLGFPTANVLLTTAVVEGIYISQTTIDGVLYPSLTFIGSSKTFNEKGIKSETYILDFNRDIYNQKITIELIKKIRDNKKFDSREELIEQMNKDKMEAEKFYLVAFRENKRGI